MISSVATQMHTHIHTQTFPEFIWRKHSKLRGKKREICEFGIKPRTLVDIGRISGGADFSLSFLVLLPFLTGPSHLTIIQLVLLIKDSLSLPGCRWRCSIICGSRRRNILIGRHQNDAIQSMRAGFMRLRR